PGRADLAGHYADATGRDRSALRWYTTLALWKLAVLYEYSRRGGTDPYYADPGARPVVPRCRGSDDVGGGAMTEEEAIATVIRGWARAVHEGDLGAVLADHAS